MEAQFRYSADNLRVALDSPGIISHIHLSPQLWIGTILHERAITWTVQRISPTILSSVLSSPPAGVFHILRHSRKIIRVNDIQLICIGGIKHILTEPQGQQGQFLHIFAVFLFPGTFQERTLSGERLIRVFKKSFLIWSQVLTRIVINGFHTHEQLLIEGHIHGVVIHHRRNLLCNIMKFIIGIRLQYIVEYF